MALSVVLILLSTYMLFTYLILDIQQDFYFEQMIREAERFSTAVINATNHSMLQDDREATRNIVKNIGKQADISDIRIYDHEGVVKFSARQDEIGTQVDKKAEACFVCHSEGKPFSEVIADKRVRIYSHDEHRILGMITPIYNHKSCYTAACHVHSEDHKVLGVLDMGKSLKGFDSHNRSLLLSTVFVGVGTFGAVLFTIILYIAFRVHRPVSRLRDAAMKIAMGELSEELSIRTQDQIGECAWAFNIMRDQIRRRTQELVWSREQYRLLFEQVPCFICVIDKNFDIIRQNSNMRTLFKGSVGMKCYEVFKKRPSKCEECHVDVTFQHGRSSGKEHCGLKVTGEEANYLSYTTPIVDEKGAILYVMLIAVDIGERVRLQKALQASVDFQTNLIENSIHGIISTDEQGHINIYNIAAENLLGYSPREAIGDADLEKYFPRLFIDMILAAHLGQKTQPTRLVAHETTLIGKQGDSVPVSFSGLILLDDGKVAGSVGFFQDLRVIKQLEREKQASDRLAAVGQTVAGLAHGIKNILSGLEGGTFVLETALEDKDDELFVRGWKMVKNNIGRISALVKDLLSYSKERSPQYEESDPNSLAEEVCALFDIKAREKNIVILRQFDPDAGERFKTFFDPRAIHACLSNFVSNAMDACEIDTKPAPHQIVVKTGQDDQGNLLFEVSDNGIGMNSEVKRKIFASFFSTKGSRGTGLGLMVTSKIVMEHGGQISFDSEEGVGSTFQIILPSADSRKNTAH